VGEVRGPSGVARPAADHEVPVWSAAACYLADVVGGEVGRGVGGAAFPSWAPVADDGAVVGHDPAPALSFLGVGVQVGSSYPLELVDLGVAVTASGLAADLPAAVQAGAEQGPGHRLRLRLAALTLTWVAQGGQRSP
jgi:hypothetical protein